MAKIYFDAATKGNPGRSACAIIIKENSQRYTFTHDLGKMDNHSAEWAAMLHALEHARELKVSNALLYTDSKLIENIEILEQSFDLMFVRWIPRKQNKEANQLAQQTLYKLTSQ